MGCGLGQCKTRVPYLEVAVENSNGMKVRKSTRKSGEDLLGEAEVDPLLQQHDRKIAVCCRLNGGGGRRTSFNRAVYVN